MKFSEIPQFIQGGSYQTNVGLGFLDKCLTEWESDEYYNLQLNPDFQRGHVWSMEQRISYVEFFLKGGRTGNTIYFNQPSWQGNATTDYDDFVCVDGLQRITSLRMFIQGRLKVFGQRIMEFKEPLRMARSNSRIVFNVNQLQTKAEVLQWYLQMNTGGTVHTESEIKRVRELLEKEKS